MLSAKTVKEEKIETLLSKSQIPIIDLAHCGTEEYPVRSVVIRVASQLQKALSEKGLAFLVNHGISEDKLKQTWKSFDDFCDLPPEVQEKYERKGEENHGYVKPGLEKFEGNKIEFRHAFNICNLNAENLPESDVPGFVEHVANVGNDFKALSKFLLQALALALDLPSTFFLERHSHMLSGNNDNETTLRVLYYPPIFEDDDKLEFVRGQCKYSYQRLNEPPDFRPEEDYRSRDDIENGDNRSDRNGERNGKVSTRKFDNITRCGAHTDYGTFTLLAQDSEGGLEIQFPGSEKWHRVGYLPGAILINTGEILSIWTEDKYPALRHRVVAPEEQQLYVKDRHSIAFFCHPDNSTMISPEEIINNKVNQDCETKKGRRGSLKVAKEKVYNAYQLIQRRFRETYGS